MKLLLVLGADDNYAAISENIRARGVEVIRYRHVLKAMDNIDEIDPAIIIISARDFPRHWKAFVQFVRSDRPKALCPIIVLKGETFNSEETSKAFFLGVNEVIKETLETQDEIGRLHNILGGQVPVYKGQKPEHRAGLLIAGLCGPAIVAADITTISAGGLSFVPAQVPQPLDAAALHRELKECSLRLNDTIISPVCRITGIGKIIQAEFVSFPGDEQKLLTRYLEEIA